jgi:hypothetical protein
MQPEIASARCGSSMRHMMALSGFGMEKTPAAIIVVTDNSCGITRVNVSQGTKSIVLASGQLGNGARPRARPSFFLTRFPFDTPSNWHDPASAPMQPAMRVPMRFWSA